MNPNSMLYWYPLVKDVDVPQPETIIVPVPPGFNPSTVLDGAPFPPKLVTAVRDACAEVGYPAFLRGDLTSGKHGWLTTCYVENPDVVPARMDALVEASIFGPGEPPGAFVARKFLSLRAPFTAFNGLPIAQERRYFVRDGQVQCHHPYWPEDALRFEGRRPWGWRKRLKVLNQETFGEVSRLWVYAERLAAHLDGYWSVDFACDGADKWWFIDAALGQESWHPPCKVNLPEAADALRP